MPARLQPLRTRDLDAALRAADEDVEALVLDLRTDADLTALNLLAAWAPVVAVRKHAGMRRLAGPGSRSRH